jgi:hypothetical protein
MRATLLGLGAVLVLAVTATLAKADPYPCPYITRQAPDACGPGYYCYNYRGAVYGPNYAVRPPWEPFNGFRPCLQCPQPAPASFGMNPFVRSPRDYFMVEPPRSTSGW